MKTRICLIAFVGLVTASMTLVSAQTRPRRAKTTTTNADGTAKTDDSLLNVVPTDKDGQPATGSTTRTRTSTTNNSGANRTTTNSSTPAANNSRPILTPKPSANSGTTTAATTPVQPAGPDVAHAIALYQQKQYAEALKEARAVIAADATKSDAWKVAGLSEMNMNKFPDAVTDLEKARDLVKADGKEDKIINDNLGEAYARTDKYDKALPLLTAATTRAGETPNPNLLQLRGVAELKGGKPDAAAISFTAASKANPKDMISLFYLGKMAFEKKDFNTSIANFNRVTAADPSDGPAWKYLVSSYWQRAFAAKDPAQADPDFLGAVRASEGLLKLGQNDDAETMHGQALYYAKQYPQAIVALEKVSASPNVKGETLLILAIAYKNTKNNPKMIATLEKAAVKSPNNASVFTYLGYGYEVDKNYTKALAAYQKAVQLAPDDASLKESVDRVKPFAK